MSRSKKEPYYTDQQTWAKRIANKKVRQRNKQATKDGEGRPADGKAYRKEYNSWNIRDFSFRVDTAKARRK